MIKGQIFFSRADKLIPPGVGNSAITVRTNKETGKAVAYSPFYVMDRTNMGDRTP
jgi:hypothetical protein